MLTIPPATVAWIILKAREFDGKDGAGGDGGDATGEDPMGVLEDNADDPTEDELTSWIDDLNDREQAELVALYWLGRGDGDTSDFADLVQQARASRVNKTSGYLLGAPLLGDYLEEAMEALGFDTSELETDAIGAG